MGLRCAVAGSGAPLILEYQKSGGACTSYRSTSLAGWQQEVSFLEN